MAELNGDVPVEGTFRDHLKNVLGDSDDDSDDDDESVSNVYESVGGIAYLLMIATANRTTSPHSVEILVPMQEFLFPPALVTTLSRRTLGPSAFPVTVATRKPQLASQPRAPLCQLPNGPEWLPAPEIGKILPRRTEESPSSLQAVQSSLGMTMLATLIGWYALLRQSVARTLTMILFWTPLKKLGWLNRRCVFQLDFHDED